MVLLECSRSRGPGFEFFPPGVDGLGSLGFVVMNCSLDILLDPVMSTRGSHLACGFSHRPHSSSFLGFILGILLGNPKKELLWVLWL